MTYGTLISTQTIGAGGAASIDFNGISGSFTDLLLVLSGRTTGTDTQGRDDIGVRFNGATTGYSARVLAGYDANQVGSATVTTGTSMWQGGIPNVYATSNVFGSFSIYIPNYAGSTNKSTSADCASENNSSNAWYDNIVAGLWSNTAAITSISLISRNGFNFVQYSTASLYGIK